MKTNKFLLFISLGLMCAAGLTSPTTMSKAATTKTTDFVIFENGAFYSEVNNHQAGSAITDGKWHNNGCLECIESLLIANFRFIQM